MTDLKLVFLRHARLLWGLLLATAILSLIRIFFESTTMLQIQGLVNMLLAVGISVYSLDYIVRFVSLGEDRMLFLSPKPRWQMLLYICLTLSALIFAQYLLAALPNVMQGTNHSLAIQGALVVSKVISIAAGFAMVSLIAFSVKSLSSRASIRFVAWASFVVVQALLLALLVLFVQQATAIDQWVLGVTIGTEYAPAFAGLVPLEILGLAQYSETIWQILGANALLALAAAIGVWLVGVRRRQNFLEL